jgi:hypothetical protein
MSEIKLEIRNGKKQMAHHLVKLINGDQKSKRTASDFHIL